MLRRQLRDYRNFTPFFLRALSAALKIIVNEIRETENEREICIYLTPHI
jgi:hypothetical protein